MLATLRVGVHELAAAQQPAAPNKYLPLPWPISMNPRYDAAAVLQLAPRNPTYYVRLAVSSGVGSSGGSGGGVVEVAVKLCRKYGLEAHQAWADLGLAPRVGLWRCGGRSCKHQNAPRMPRSVPWHPRSVLMLTGPLPRVVVATGALS